MSVMDTGPAAPQLMEPDRKPRAGMPRPEIGDIGAAAFLLAVVAIMAFAPSLAPFPVTEFHPQDALIGPNATYWFGTDEFGRDVFSRVLVGARPTLIVAFLSALFGVALGTMTGLVAGYAKGWVDEAVMRVMDALMSFPGLILAMLVVVMLGSAAANVVFALAIVFWPRSARLIRSAVIDVAEREFVAAARSRGESRLYILTRELLPNVWPIIIVDLGLRVTAAILLSASLAYLGIGATPPTPAWGLMVHDGQPFMQIAPWLVLFPCLAVAFASVGGVMVGERFRKWLADTSGDRSA